MRRLSSIAFVAVSAAAIAAHAQTSARPTAFILGQVVDAVANRPVGGATVTIALASGMAEANRPAPATGARVLCDDQGRFLFRDLAAGTYALTATAPGYLDGGFGQRTIEGSPRTMTIRDAEHIGSISIRLWPEASITGTVTDESSGAVSGISVGLLPVEAGGSDRNRIVTGAAQFAWADDRGAFRFGRLRPGNYVAFVATTTTALPIDLATADGPTLQAIRDTGSAALASGAAALGPVARAGDFLIQTNGQSNLGAVNQLAGRLPIVATAGGRFSGYATTFFSNAPTISGATTIALRVGENRADVRMQLMPVPLVPVSGTMAGPDGPLAHAAVHLIPSYAAGTMLERTNEAAITVTDAAGRFTFPAVRPGPYVLKGWRVPPTLVIGRDPLPSQPTLWGQQEITVNDRDSTGNTLTLEPGRTFSGRIEFVGATPPPAPAALQTFISAMFEPAWPLVTSARPAVRVNDAREFVTIGLPSGSYGPIGSNTFAPRGWYLESVMREGKDLCLTSLEVRSADVAGIVVRFSDKRIDLSGTVHATGTSDPDATVIVFPADFRQWIHDGLPASAARLETVSQTGAFTIVDLRPGDYRVVAVSPGWLTNWRQAQRVAQFAEVSTPVTLVRGESKTIDLKRVEGREQ